MSSKRYPKISEEPAAERSMVNEAKPEIYGRQSERPKATGFASSIAAVKGRIKNPLQRSKAEIAWALEIAGIGAGPVDLSENKGDYLYGGR
ncbi:MAG: hypothetical protein HYU31_05980 [Deltaproteobacteria bacterium]|nr:hypothetical protein [Deltaproteobacteria bacterium]MBI2180352.1 hypothetical protein [Deltaproteobacteria bacterium]MBI2229685.1 hypothetical protein [Deltaproteobacteria bacterium]MBI2363618.1 hypothetical protein [Deltaproteobacteria bacterium]MBI2533730.1 hypothetical protein [Deltaproteobacteria bacterium]